MDSSWPLRTLLTSPMLTAAGFAHAFPERDAGDADLHAAVGHDVIVRVKQVHGARALEVRCAADAAGQAADALVARSGGAGPLLAVGVRVADCVPILIGDQASGDVAAIHAGWRGVVGGVLLSALDLLTAPDARASLVAAIGPCIGACCFEVGREVAEPMAAAAHGTPILSREHGAKAHADLRAAVRAQLRACGVPDARIDDVPGCTKHEPARFYSFRRDGAESGRMLAAIACRAAR